MAESPDLRLSDAERDAAAERLRGAAGEGRLTVEELDDRLGAAYAARTRRDLDAVLGDLPEAGHASAPTRAARAPAPPAGRHIVGVMGGARRRGRFRLGAETTVVAVMGGADLDLREAELDADVVDVRVLAVMGGVDVRVPDRFRVELTGFALMGGNDLRDRGEEAPAGAPLVRIHATALMGGVNVRRGGVPVEPGGLPPLPRPPSPPATPPG